MIFNVIPFETMTNQELTEMVYDAAMPAFEFVRQAFDDDELLGYAIISDDSANNCQPVFATDRGMESFYCGTKEEFLYCPENWDYSACSNSFNGLNNLLGEYETDKERHSNLRRHLFESCVSALEQIVSEGFFDNILPKHRPFIVLGLTDSDRMKTLAPGWVRRLNPQPVIDRYLDWHAKTYKTG